MLLMGVYVKTDLDLKTGLSFTGKYRATPAGLLRTVQGDMATLQLVVGLPEAARTILSNVQHASSGIPGALEGRQVMRLETHAYRVVYGEPIFVTATPRERAYLNGRRGDHLPEKVHLYGVHLVSFLETCGLLQFS